MPAPSNQTSRTRRGTDPAARRQRPLLGTWARRHRLPLVDYRPSTSCRAVVAGRVRRSRRLRRSAQRIAAMHRCCCTCARVHDRRGTTRTDADLVTEQLAGGPERTARPIRASRPVRTAAGVLAARPHCRTRVRQSCHDQHGDDHRRRRPRRGTRRRLPTPTWSPRAHRHTPISGHYPIVAGHRHCRTHVRESAHDRQTDHDR